MYCIFLATYFSAFYLWSLLWYHTIPSKKKHSNPLFIEGRNKCLCRRCILRFMYPEWCDDRQLKIYLPYISARYFCQIYLPVISQLNKTKQNYFKCTLVFDLLFIIIDYVL